MTGGSGFIGSHLVELLLELGYEVWNISKITYCVNPKTLSHLEGNSKYHFLPFDILQVDDLRRFIDEKQIEQIFHLAASTHVDRSFNNPREFFLNNTMGTFSVLEAIRLSNMKPRLYYMGTDEVFGDVPSGFCVEDDVREPRNPYSASKASSEMYCTAYYHSYGLPILVGRSMNNFGPRQHPEKLLGKIISKCVKKEHYTLYKGASTRGWIYVRDTAIAVNLIMEKGKPGEFYHIPPTCYRTVPEVNETILELMDAQELFDGYKGRRLKDDERYALDASKMTGKLGFSHEHTFSEALNETIEWWKRNVWFWKN